MDLLRTGIAAGSVFTLCCPEMHQSPWNIGPYLSWISLRMSFKCFSIWFTLATSPVPQKISLLEWVFTSSFTTWKFMSSICYLNFTGRATCPTGFMTCLEYDLRGVLTGFTHFVIFIFSTFLNGITSHIALVSKWKGMCFPFTFRVVVNLFGFSSIMLTLRRPMNNGLLSWISPPEKY